MERKEYMSKRLRQLPPYLFAEIDRLKAEEIAKGTDVIDMGVGDPDLAPPQAVIDSLNNSSHEEGAHHYSSYIGIAELRKEFALWFEKRSGIMLNPDTEVLPLIGSKEGVGHIFLATLDPGDEVLVPDPGYPVYTAGAVLAGAVPKYFPLRRENGFLPDRSDLERSLSPHTKMLWLNYPSNPTTTMATREIFEDIIDFAQKNGIIVCHDAAYAEIVFDGQKALSMLQVSGGLEVGVEFHSLSKTYCMPGWRVGFAAGNSSVIKALAKVKTNLDSGIFIPIQKAAITALRECETEACGLRQVFENRRNRFIKGLSEIGWHVPLPSSTFYVWAPVPKGYDSMGFTSMLLREGGIVSTPGIGFGPNGEGFVRMSLTMPEYLLEGAIERMKKMNISWS